MGLLSVGATVNLLSRFRECPQLLTGAACAAKHTYARADSRSVMLLNVPGRTRTTLVCTTSLFEPLCNICTGSSPDGDGGSLEDHAVMGMDDCNYLP